MSWTDEEIDKLYQERSNNLSFDYNDSYWGEMDAMLDKNAIADGELTDAAVDDMYKSSAENLAFEYKDTYWQQFEAMLPSNRKLDGLWFATAALFVGLLLFTPFLKQDIVANSTTSTAAVDTNKETTTDIHKSTLNTSAEQDEQLNTVSNSTTPTAVNEVSSQSIEKINGDVNKVDKGQQNVVNTNAVNNSTENNTVSNQTEKSTEIQNTVSKDVQIVQNKVNVAAVQQLENELNKEVKPSTVKERETSEGIEISEVNNLPYNEITSSSYSPSLASAIYDFKLPAITTFYVEVKGGFSQSMITPSDRTSHSYGIGFGTQIQKGKFVFNIGVSGLLSKHSDLVLTREAKVYGFGSEVVRYQLNYDQFYILEGDFSIGYNLGRHQLRIGARPSYIVGSKVGYLEEQIDQTSIRQTLYGYTDGVNKVGVKPSVGYMYNFNKGVSLGFNVGAQVLKSINEDYIDGFNNTLPIDGQLFIRKTLY